MVAVASQRKQLCSFLHAGTTAKRSKKQVVVFGLHFSENDETVSCYIFFRFREKAKWASDHHLLLLNPSMKYSIPTMEDHNLSQENLICSQRFSTTSDT